MCCCLSFCLLRLMRSPRGLSLRAVLASRSAGTLGGLSFLLRSSRSACTLSGLSFLFGVRSCHRGVFRRRSDLYAQLLHPFLFGNRGDFFLLGIDQAFGLSVQPRLNARRNLWRLLLRRHHFDGRLNSSKQQGRCGACHDNRSHEIREQATEHATRPSRPRRDCGHGLSSGTESRQFECLRHRSRRGRRHGTPTTASPRTHLR
jgi:hypothetical protein